MDPTPALRLGNSLYAVHAAFIFQSGIRALTRDHEHALLKSADTVLIERDHLCSPSPAVRIVDIHAVDFRCKESRLVSARASADLHNNILIIVGVLGEKENLKLLLQLIDALLRFIQFFLRQLTHLLICLILQHGKAVVNILFTFLILTVRFHDGR